MPKLRNKKPRRVIKKTKKRGSIGIYLIVGVFTIFIIWLILREPADIGFNSSTAAQEKSEISNAPDKSTTSHKYKEAKRVSEEQQSSHKTATNKKAKTSRQKPIDRLEQNSQATVQLSMDESITNTISKLGIPKSFYKRKKSDDAITYSIPIDRSVMDLVYANMIFKGELERNGGVFIKGTDTSGKQSLIFGSKATKEKYVINLYYDSKQYSEKQTPRNISIVVDDFGAIGGDLLNGFMSLDKEITFAIFPDEVNSITTMQKATAQGRETIIHVPMEPIGYPKVNPGKNALYVQYSGAEIDKLLTRFIRQLPDCIGINNHMGSLASTDEATMRAVMATLKKHNKVFLDSRTSNVSVAYAVAQKAHIRSYRNDLFLDSPNISQSTMDAKLSQLIALSSTRSNIIAITHCHNQEKLDYLKSLINRLKAAGFTLVPLSKVGQYNVPGLL